MSDDWLEESAKKLAEEIDRRFVEELNDKFGKEPTNPGFAIPENEPFMSIEDVEIIDVGPIEFQHTSLIGECYCCGNETEYRVKPPVCRSCRDLMRPDDEEL